jgi:hypothetical protein
MWITSGDPRMREQFWETQATLAGTVNFASVGCGTVRIESGRWHERVKITSRGTVDNERIAHPQLNRDVSARYL